MQHKAKKRFGQNFLKDQMVLTHIIKSIDLREDDKVVEIGPGLGALTEHLISPLKQLHVIEIDRDAVLHLKHHIVPQEKLIIHQDDVLKVNFEKIAEGEKLRVVGNFPYNISTPILFHLLEFRESITDIHAMLQKEVVERICAKPGNKNYGRLSVILQYFFDAEYLFTVSPEAFTPQPKVTSAIIRLNVRENITNKAVSEINFMQLVKLAFANRRKTLNNNLKQKVCVDKLMALGYDLSRRAETLSFDDFVNMSNALED